MKKEVEPPEGGGSFRARPGQDLGGGLSCGPPVKGIAVTPEKEAAEKLPHPHYCEENYKKGHYYSEE